MNGPPTHSDVTTVRDWLRDLPDLDFDESAADGGVTVGMVVQQQAREMAARLDRYMSAAHPPPKNEAPEPPWSATAYGNFNAKRAGWTAYFAGEGRDKCPFPPARDDLRRAYQEGWDTARTYASIDGPGLPPR